MGQLSEEAALGQLPLRLELTEAVKVGVVGDLAVLGDRLRLNLPLKLLSYSFFLYESGVGVTEEFHNLGIL